MSSTTSSASTTTSYVAATSTTNAVGDTTSTSYVSTASSSLSLDDLDAINLLLSIMSEIWYDSSSSAAMKSLAGTWSTALTAARNVVTLGGVVGYRPSILNADKTAVENYFTSSTSAKDDAQSLQLAANNALSGMDTSDVSKVGLSSSAISGIIIASLAVAIILLMLLTRSGSGFARNKGMKSKKRKRAGRGKR